MLRCWLALDQASLPGTCETEAAECTKIGNKEAWIEVYISRHIGRHALESGEKPGNICFESKVRLD